MDLLQIILVLATLLTTVFGQVKNTTREFQLKTNVKPNQSGKDRFDGLWLVSYHTGAGLDDATFVSNRSQAIKGFMNGTNGHVDDVTYHNLVFDLGNPFPWHAIIDATEAQYAAWEPVNINAAGDIDTSYGFFVNSTGLQVTNAVDEPAGGLGDAFGGWIVCDWWHGVPQLFYRIKGVDVKAPCSCADVQLRPEYL